MKSIIGIMILCVISSACCREDSIEAARYELATDEIALLPYQYGEKINFTHSNGYSFDFNVIEDVLEWERSEQFCEWSCCGNDYFSYQLKRTILESSYPRFHVKFSLGESYGQYAPQVLSVEINYTHFVQIPYDSLGNFTNDTSQNTRYYDSIYLANKLYFNVVQKDFERHYSGSDSSALGPLSIYFNELGMIQLEMYNDETFTINN